MTGSVGDAEDIVQDTFLGLTRARQAGTTIADPKAYLTTAVTRLGINYLSSARVRRETYVGDWLPEPVVVPADGPGPAGHAELADSLSMAFLVLLEALSLGVTPPPTRTARHWTAASAWRRAAARRLTSCTTVRMSR
jgi:RNA polymerase sigma-70 factor (ECF subfamily)